MGSSMGTHFSPACSAIRSGPRATMRSLPVLPIVLTTTILDRCNSFSTSSCALGRSPCHSPRRPRHSHEHVRRTPVRCAMRPGGILEEVDAPQLEEGSVEIVRERALTQQLDESNEDEETSERGLGILVLLTVPLAWGTCEFSATCCSQAAAPLTFIDLQTPRQSNICTRWSPRSRALCLVLVTI